MFLDNIYSAKSGVKINLTELVNLNGAIELKNRIINCYNSYKVEKSFLFMGKYFDKKELNFWCINLILVIMFVILFKQSLFFLSSIILLSISSISFFYNRKSNKSNIGTWMFTGIMFLFSFLVFFLYLKNINFISVDALALAFIVFVFMLFLMALFSWFPFLLKSKKLVPIIFSYLILAILLISLFVGAYALFGGVTYGGQPLVQDEYITFNYYYLSALTFYSMGHGDFIPTGNARIVSMIEVAMGSLLHVIVLGWILSKKK